MQYYIKILYIHSEIKVVKVYINNEYSHSFWFYNTDALKSIITEYCNRLIIKDSTVKIVVDWGNGMRCNYIGWENNVSPGNIFYVV